MPHKAGPSNTQCHPSAHSKPAFTVQSNSPQPNPVMLSEAINSTIPKQVPFGIEFAIGTKRFMKLRLKRTNADLMLKALDESKKCFLLYKRVASTDGCSTILFEYETYHEQSCIMAALDLVKVVNLRNKIESLLPSLDCL